MDERHPYPVSTLIECHKICNLAATMIVVDNNTRVRGQSRFDKIVYRAKSTRGYAKFEPDIDTLRRPLYNFNLILFKESRSFKRGRVQITAL